MEVVIRRGEPSDAPTIAALLRSLGWFAHLQSEEPGETRERVAQHIARCQADDSHACYVAEVQDQLLGYAAVHWLPYLFLPGPEGYLSELFVDERYRARGIGKRLLAEVVTEARRRSCSRLMLINSRNRESYQRGYYARLGWREREGVANFILEL